MAKKKPQTFANHARLDPLFHFFLLPIFGLSTLAAIVLFLWHPGLPSAWRFVLIAAATVAVFKIRLYPLRVQDRVIRLEERPAAGFALARAVALAHSRIDRRPDHRTALRLGWGSSQADRADSFGETLPGGYQEGHPDLASGLLARLIRASTSQYSVGLPFRSGAESNPSGSFSPLTRDRLRGTIF